jgi:hypothetical protein
MRVFESELILLFVTKYNNIKQSILSKSNENIYNPRIISRNFEKNCINLICHLSNTLKHTFVTNGVPAKYLITC